MNSGAWQRGWPTSLFLPLCGAHTKRTKFLWPSRCRLIPGDYCLVSDVQIIWYQAAKLIICLDTGRVFVAERHIGMWHLLQLGQHSEQKKKEKRRGGEWILPVKVCSYAFWTCQWMCFFFFLSKWVRRVKWVIEARKGILLCIIKCFPLEIQHSFQYWV